MISKSRTYWTRPIQSAPLWEPQSDWQNLVAQTPHLTLWKKSQAAFSRKSQLLMNLYLPINKQVTFSKIIIILRAALRIAGFNPGDAGRFHAASFQIINFPSIDSKTSALGLKIAVQAEFWSPCDRFRHRFEKTPTLLTWVVLYRNF